MAERKSEMASEGEGYEVPVPPFDAETYVRTEVINARASIVLVLLGLLIGEVSAVLQTMLQNALAAFTPLLLGFVGVKGVLELMGVDHSGWDRKAWLGHGAVLFFTWLMAWVLFQNEPFVLH